MLPKMAGPTTNPFDLTEEHTMLREMVARFASTGSPSALRERGTLDRALFEKLGDQGLLGITIPEDDGGAGMDTTAAVIVHHELSKYDPGFCLAYLAHSMLFVNNFYFCSNEEQRARYLPKTISGEWVAGMGMTEPGAGTDVLGMTTTAVEDGDHWVLNGTKTYITNGCEGFASSSTRRWKGRSPRSWSTVIAPGSPPPTTLTSSGCAARPCPSSSLRTAGCPARTFSARSGAG